jgi:hypothetical protein
MCTERSEAIEDRLSMHAGQGCDLAYADAMGSLDADKEAFALAERLATKAHGVPKPRSVTGNAGHHQITQPIANANP